jgi:hypothetical protein
MTTRSNTPRSIKVAQSSSPIDALLLVGVAGLLTSALALWLHAALVALLPLVVR